MQRLLILALILLSAGRAMAYQETVQFGEIPKLSVIVEPRDLSEEGGHVHGQIILTLRVSSSYPFAALDLAVPEFDGAAVITLVKPKTRELKASYAGKGHVLETVLALFPEKSGTFTIPEVRATGRVEPDGKDPIEFDDRSPPIPIEIAGIASGYGDDWWMVSRRVEISETWSKPKDQITEGEVVRRTVHVWAAGVPHQRMPDLKPSRTQGVLATEAEGRAWTERTAEGVVGHIEKSWDLKIVAGRVIYVSPLGVSYFHPEEHIADKAFLAGQRIEPIPANQDAVATALMVEAHAAHRGHRRIGLAVLVLLTLPFAALALAWLWTRVPTRGDQRLRTSLSGADPAMAYRAIRHWAAEEGVDLTADNGPAFNALSGVLFGSATQSPNERTLTRELWSASRRNRAIRLWVAVCAIPDRLLGERTRLSR